MRSLVRFSRSSNRGQTGARWRSVVPARLRRPGCHAGAHPINRRSQNEAKYMTACTIENREALTLMKGQTAGFDAAPGNMAVNNYVSTPVRLE